MTNDQHGVPAIVRFMEGSDPPKNEPGRRAESTAAPT